MVKKTVVAISVAALAGAGAIAVLSEAVAQTDKRPVAAQRAPCNPCAAKKASNPCNPCAAKAPNPCKPRKSSHIYESWDDRNPCTPER